MCNFNKGTVYRISDSAFAKWSELTDTKYVNYALATELGLRKWTPTVITGVDWVLAIKMLDTGEIVNCETLNKKYNCDSNIMFFTNELEDHKVIKCSDTESEPEMPEEAYSVLTSRGTYDPDSGFLIRRKNVTKEEAEAFAEEYANQNIGSEVILFKGFKVYKSEQSVNVEITNY